MSRSNMETEGAIRVVRIITRLNVGGPSIQAIELTRRLTARGYQTRLVHGRLGQGEGDMRYLLPADADVQSVGSLRRSMSPLHDAIALARLLDLFRDVRPHIVHTHMAKAGSLGRLAASIYNRTAGRSHPAKVVHTYHGHVLEGYFSPTVEAVFSFAERQLARATDAIVAISPHVKAELTGRFRIGRAAQYRVVPLGFDLSSFLAVDEGARRTAREALHLREEDRVVTTVGRLTAIKQHSLFLETARQVALRDPAAILLIAGDGELRSDLENQADRLGIADRTRFLGWRRDLSTIYAATDVFLLTSRNEGTPVALIESLASGVPVVSTDVGGVRDVVQSEAMGLVAPFGDARALADHVTELLGDPDRRRLMGRCGRDAVAARYHIDRLVDDIDALYRRLLR